MSLTYRAIWEIADDDRPASALIAEAGAALPAMARTDGARITGTPVWTVAGRRLVCVAPAEALPDDQLVPLDRNRRDAEVIRLAGLRWSSAQIGAVLGIPATTVRDALRRHGVRTAFKPGGQPRDDESEAA